MCAGCDCLCDLIEMQPRCFGVDARQDQPGRRATGRTGCAEDIAPFAARITWCARAGSTPGPFAGEGSLLPDAGFILKPYLKRLPLCMFWQGIGYEAGKVFLKACCAAGSVPGCSGRTERRRKPCLAGYLPIVRSCSFTSNSSSTRTCKSAQRHRTTPSFAGSGPASTQATNSACCSRDRRGLAPLPHRSESPPGPSALQRCTQSSLREFGDPYRCYGPLLRGPHRQAPALWRVFDGQHDHPWFALQHNANPARTYLCA